MSHLKVTSISSPYLSHKDESQDSNFRRKMHALIFLGTRCASFTGITGQR